jgi:type I restriction enzyme S subunit
MRLYTDRFGTIKLPVPPREEQQSLVQSIAEGTQHIDRTQERIRCEITLCQEYRTRLVADVVTGKLDVREAAARLPDEAAQPEPLGDADEVADAVENGGDDGVRPEEVEA